MNYKSNYNNELIYYCLDCLAPAIVLDEEELYTCLMCGNSNYGRATLADWEELFYSKYGCSFMEIPNDEFKKMSELL